MTVYLRMKLIAGSRQLPIYCGTRHRQSPPAASVGPFTCRGPETWESSSAAADLDPICVVSAQAG